MAKIVEMIVSFSNISGPVFISPQVEQLPLLCKYREINYLLLKYISLAVEFRWNFIEDTE